MQHRFEKGHKKRAGRKKGVPNKTTLMLRETLSKLDCNVEEQLAAAIAAQNIEMIKALTALLPYLSPKYKEIDTPQPKEKEKKDNADNIPTEKLLGVVK